MKDPGGSVIFCSYVPATVPRSGEQVRVNAFWRGLASLGLKVHAFAPPEASNPPDDLLRYNIAFYRARLPWPQFSRNPWDYWRIDPDLIRQISAITAEEPVAAIILDYGFLGQYIEPLRRLGVPVILGTHNAQAALTRQIPRRSLIHRVSLRAAFEIERWHERRYFSTADAVLCVSEEDRAYHSRFIEKAKIHLLPNFIDQPVSHDALTRANRVIMTASFTNFQNLAGIRWFLNEVWNTELASMTSLCLAGRGSIEALKSLGSFPNVHALGERDDLHHEIAASLCAIAPILHASGTRLKCIEALALKTPLLSTSLGAEGLDHEGAIAIADIPAMFQAQLKLIIKDASYRSRLAEKGFQVFDRKYSMKSNIHRLEKIFASVARGRIPD